jgi:hypothetical protein
LTKEVGQRKVKKFGFGNRSEERKGTRPEEREEFGTRKGTRFRIQEPKCGNEKKVNCLGENSLTIGQGVLQDEDWGMTTRGRC